MKPRDTRWQDTIGWVITLIPLGLLAYPTVRWLVSQWLTNEYYSHGPLVPLVSAYLGWRVLRQRSTAPITGNPTPILLVVSAGLYLLAEVMAADYVAALALIGLIGGVIGFLQGRTTLQRLALPLAYLVFGVPFPFIDQLAVQMGSLTAAWATRAVQLLGVAAVNEGGQVTLPSCSLVVGAPCSGVRSLVALLALAAVWAFTVRGPRLTRIGLLLAAIPLAALSNLLRITSLLWVAERWGVETALSYYHDVSGPLFFALALAGLLALSWGLKCRDLCSDI
ncbi:MAG: exosortase/archaeosortase family protein [Chloroflexota bacterium]